MGYPMVENLVKKLPPKTEIYVYDISEQALVRIIANNGGQVYSCRTAKDVAEKSVSDCDTLDLRPRNSQSYCANRRYSKSL